MGESLTSLPVAADKAHLNAKIEVIELGEPITSIQPPSIQPRSLQPADGMIIIHTPPVPSSSLITYYHQGRELHPGVEIFDTPGTYTLLAVFEPSEHWASTEVRASTEIRAMARTRARIDLCYLGSSAEVTLVVLPREEKERYLMTAASSWTIVHLHYHHHLYLTF